MKVRFRQRGVGLARAGDVTGRFFGVSGVIWFLRLRNAKDLTSDEHAL